LTVEGGELASLGGLEDGNLEWGDRVVRLWELSIILHFISNLSKGGVLWGQVTGGSGLIVAVNIRGIL
jgi:hypothetical protein